METGGICGLLVGAAQSALARPEGAVRMEAGSAPGPRPASQALSVHTQVPLLQPKTLCLVSTSGEMAVLPTSVGLRGF